MSRERRTNPLNVSQLSVARRSAMARGWTDRSRKPATPVRSHDIERAIGGFARQVALATNGPILRYSQRLELLALANDAGIARFDANLIIAAIENRRDVCLTPSPARSSRQGRIPTLLAAAGLQAVLIAFAWIVLVV